MVGMATRKTCVYRDGCHMRIHKRINVVLLLLHTLENRETCVQVTITETWFHQDMIQASVTHYIHIILHILSSQKRNHLCSNLKDILMVIWGYLHIDMERATLSHTARFLHHHWALLQPGSSEENSMMTSSNGNIFRVTGLCAGNSPVTGEFPAQRPVMRSFDVFFDLRLNQQFSQQWRRWWSETPSRSFWSHCNG